jgi:hypothetical protein
MASRIIHCSPRCEAGKGLIGKVVSAPRPDWDKGIPGATYAVNRFIAVPCVLNLFSDQLST